MEDYERLNGKWLQTYSNENGIDNPEGDEGLGSFTEFNNGQFSVHSPDGTLVLEGRYTLSQNVNPPEIDWTDTMGSDKGKSFLAIYHLTNSSFIFSAADEGMDRPNSIKPQHNHTIRKFLRVRPKL